MGFGKALVGVSKEEQPEHGLGEVRGPQACVRPKLVCGGPELGLYGNEIGSHEIAKSLLSRSFMWLRLCSIAEFATAVGIPPIWNGRPVLVEPRGQALFGVEAAGVDSGSGPRVPCRCLRRGRIMSHPWEATLIPG